MSKGISELQEGIKEANLAASVEEAVTSPGFSQDQVQGLLSKGKARAKKTADNAAEEWLDSSEEGVEDTEPQSEQTADEEPEAVDDEATEEQDAEAPVQEENFSEDYDDELETGFVKIYRQGFRRHGHKDYERDNAKLIGHARSFKEAIEQGYKPYAVHHKGVPVEDAVAYQEQGLLVNKDNPSEVIREEDLPKGYVVEEGTHFFVKPKKSKPKSKKVETPTSEDVSRETSTPEETPAEKRVEVAKEVEESASTTETPEAKEENPVEEDLEPAGEEGSTEEAPVEQDDVSRETPEVETFVFEDTSQDAAVEQHAEDVVLETSESAEHEDAPSVLEDTTSQDAVVETTDSGQVGDDVPAAEQESSKSVADVDDYQVHGVFHRDYSADANDIIPSAEELKSLLDPSIEISEARGALSLAAKTSAQSNLMILRSALRDGIAKLMRFTFPLEWAKKALEENRVPALENYRAEHRAGQDLIRNTQDGLAQWEAQWNANKQAYMEEAMAKLSEQYDQLNPPMDEARKQAVWEEVNKKLEIIEGNLKIYKAQAKREFLLAAIQDHPEDDGLRALDDFMRAKDLGYAGVAAQVEAEKVYFSSTGMNPIVPANGSIISTPDGQVRVVNTDNGVSMEPAEPFVAGDANEVSDLIDPAQVSDADVPVTETSEEEEALLALKEAQEKVESEEELSAEEKFDRLMNGINNSEPEGDIKSDIFEDRTEHGSRAYSEDDGLGELTPEEIARRNALSDDAYSDDDDVSEKGPGSIEQTKRSAVSRLPFLNKFKPQQTQEEKEEEASDDKESSFLTPKRAGLIGGAGLLAISALVFGVVALTGNDSESTAPDPTTSVSGEAVTKDIIISWYNAGDRMTIENEAGASVSVTLTGEFNDDGAVAKASNGDTYTIGYQQLKDHRDENPELFGSQETASASATEK